jgi:uncharacterized protein
MAVRLIDAAAARKLPWANGLGVTRELVRRETPQRQLLCRLSIAEVIAPVEFSQLPGIDRQLILIEGLGFELKIADQLIPMIPFVPVSFSGDDAVSAVHVAGLSRDFNVMVDRQVARAEVTVHRSGFAHRAPPLCYYYVAAGTFSTPIAGQCLLESGTLVEKYCALDTNVQVSGSGVLIVVGVLTRQDKGA